jgi:hypothetical protein
MAKNFRRIFNGLQLVGQNATTPSLAGEVRYNSSTNKFQIYDGTSARYFVSDTGTETLTNKTLTGNTAVNLISGSGTLVLNTSGTITLPNATDTLVGKATSDTLTNKVLSGNTAVTLISGSGTLTLNTSGTVTLPNATDTLVGKATTDTLTNKTLTGNTAVNLVSGSGTLILNTSGTVTLPNATDTLVGKATTDTLTNKTLTSPIVSDAVLLAEVATPATPSSGYGKVYFKSDGFLYQLNDDGTETKVGAGAGGINYVSNPDAESSTSGWTMYADAAGTAPVDGTGGSPNSALSRISSSVLRGTGSFRITKNSGASRQGEGVSTDFTIANADLAKPLNISFEYQVSSGVVAGSDSASGDFNVYIIADPSGTPVVIQPTPYKLPGGSGGKWKYSGTFQTLSDVTSYRLCIHTAGTTNAAGTFDFDSVTVGPQIQLYGSPITDWVSFTPTGSWTSNVGYSGRWRRVGDTMEVVGEIAFSGDSDASTLTLNLPSGYSIDTTKLTSTGSERPLGQIEYRDASDVTFTGNLWYQSTTSVVPRYINNNDGAGRGVFQAGVDGTTPIATWANNDRIHYKFAVPIAGWGSNVLMSNDTDTRVIASRAYKASNQTSVNTNASYVKINLDTTLYDTHSGFASNKYTAPISGYYQVSALIGLAGTNVLNNFYLAAIYKNGSLFSGGVAQYPVATGAFSVSVSDIVQLNAGDYIELYLYGNGNNSSSTLTVVGGNGAQTSTYLSIQRISGPATIAASELIAARYSTDAGQSISGSDANNIINYEDKDYDTHGAVAVGASWKFTAPAPGKYHVSVYNNLTGVANGNRLIATLYKNGSGFARLQAKSNNSGSSTNLDFQGNVTVNLLAGDYIHVNLVHDEGSANTLEASGTTNYIQIHRIGF